MPPYTGDHLRRLLKEVGRSRDLKVETGPMPLWTITGRNSPSAGKKVIWLMFRQHAWETGSSWAGEGAIRFLLSNGPEAVRIRRGAIFKIFPMADPEGVRLGKVRFNQAGFDLNRNWDVDDPVRMPEIAAQKQAILKWLDAGGRLDLFLSLHNTETGEYLEGPPAGHEELAQRFFVALHQHSTFAPTRPLFRGTFTTTEGKPGRMTVSQGLYRLRKLPAFTMEQMIARNPKLGHFPTIEDRVTFGAGLVRAAFAALTPGI